MSRFLLLGMILLVAYGCTNKVRCQARSLKMTVIGSDKLNPDDRGRSSPVQIKIYQLKSTARLENSSFDSMWKNDQQTLGEDLLGVTERTIFPTQETPLEIKRKDPNSQLAVMAIFRKPSGLSWRAIQILPNDNGLMCPEDDPRLPPQKISFFLEDYRVETRQGQ